MPTFKVEALRDGRPARSACRQAESTAFDQAAPALSQLPFRSIDVLISARPSKPAKGRSYK